MIPKNNSNGESLTPSGYLLVRENWQIEIEKEVKEKMEKIMEMEKRMEEKQKDLDEKQKEIEEKQRDTYEEIERRMEEKQRNVYEEMEKRLKMLVETRANKEIDRNLTSPTSCIPSSKGSTSYTKPLPSKTIILITLGCQTSRAEHLLIEPGLGSARQRFFRLVLVSPGSRIKTNFYLGIWRIEPETSHMLDKRFIIYATPPFSLNLIFFLIFST